MKNQLKLDKTLEEFHQKGKKVKFYRVFAGFLKAVLKNHQKFHWKSIEKFYFIFCLKRFIDFMIFLASWTQVDQTKIEWYLREICEYWFKLVIVVQFKVEIMPEIKF